MRQDVTTLESFYASPLGQAAAKTLSSRMQSLWGGCKAEQVLGFGFATPLLDRIGPDAQIKVAAMPAAQGALTWAPNANGVATVLCDEVRLPFRDGMFSRLVVMHGLEESSAPDALLRELWRVLAPEGRLIVIASNRLGLWARSESTPFGHGRPWTRGQLARVLGEAMFQTTAWTHGLHMPPTGWPPVLALHEGWEKVGERVSAIMGGVVLIEATKRLYLTSGGEKISFSPAKAVRATKGLAHRAQK